MTSGHIGSTGELLAHMLPRAIYPLHQALNYQFRPLIVPLQLVYLSNMVKPTQYTSITKMYEPIPSSSSLKEVLLCVDSPLG